MNRSELKQKLFRSLKTSSKTLDELHIELGVNLVTKKEIAACLDKFIKEGWIERYGGYFRLKYVFDLVLKTPPQNKDWEYEKIQSAYTPEEIARAGKRPDSYMNPYIDWIPQCDQYERETCTGFSGKYAAWLKQLQLVDPPLDPNETVKIQYDVPVSAGCNMLVDKMHVFSPSAEDLYQSCRKLENVTIPAGCYIRGIMRAWKERGYVFEVDRMTSKTSRCAPKYYPLQGTEAETEQYLVQEGSTHKIDGYAQITTWEGLKDAIWNYGVVLVAINVYSNMESNGKEGPFPDPKGNPIGAHAMCAVGYDENYVYVLHSWRQGWSKVGGFSKKYYTQACGTAYAPIDSIDVVIAKEEYGTVTVTTNVPCNIIIGKDEYRNKTTAKSSWILGKECAVSCSPLMNIYKENEQHTATTPTKEKPDITLTFQFIPKNNQDKIKEIFDKLKKSLEDLIKKLKERFK